MRRTNFLSSLTKSIRSDAGLPFNLKLNVFFLVTDIGCVNISKAHPLVNRWNVMYSKGSYNVLINNFVSESIDDIDS